MNTLTFPVFTQTSYPVLRYPAMNNLQRDTRYNRDALREHVARVNYHLPNQHVLVGLLQQLTIDPEWELEYLVSYVRLRAYSLCSLFKITNLQNVGEARKNVFYYNDMAEVLCMIDNNKQYNASTLDIEKLTPVIPLYTTDHTHSYKPSIDRKDGSRQLFAGVSIIGIDLVELAIGWWLYMKQDRTTDTAIHAFLVKYPLVNAQLIHNQLNVINVLYEHIVNEKPYSQLSVTEDVTFITANVLPGLEKYYSWLSTVMMGRRFKNIEHLVRQISSIYPDDHFNYVSEGENECFSQTRWCWEPRTLKLYAIYLTLANKLFYQASDITTKIDVAIPKMINNYQKIPDKYVREHLISLATQVKTLNTTNRQ